MAETVPPLEQRERILAHYREPSMYTNPGPYKDALRALPDDVREIGKLLRTSTFIHRTTLEWGNVGTNHDLKFGDMREISKFRQPEDDILVTAPAMLAELYRRDDRGIVADRAVDDRLILTCRYVSIMMASILKAKGIPTRVRAGQAPYFNSGDTSTDHWINQYWDKDQARWITIDVDGSLSMNRKDLDPYDMPEGSFDFPADAWLRIREKKVEPNYFVNAGGYSGAQVVLWSLFYDFHSLMNNETHYMHHPQMVSLGNYDKITDDQFEGIDELARLMQDPDANFDKLKQVWETRPEYRFLHGSLLGGDERKGPFWKSLSVGENQ